MISFKFAALNFRAPRQTRYRYRLEGFDEDWIEVGSAGRLVTYTNLAPSTYVFRVSAANADGVWNEAGRAIEIIVTPPWWATWWFRALAVTLLAGCLASAYAWRVNRLHRRRQALEAEIVVRTHTEEALRASHRQIQDLAGRLIHAQEEERTRIARDLHDDLGQRVASLSIALSGVRRQVPESSATMLEQLSGLQRDTMTLSRDLRQIAHELHPGVLEHLGLVKALESRCAEVAVESGMTAKVVVDAEWSDVSDPIDLCLYRIAQEALRNSVTHGHAQTALIALARQNGQVLMRITDDGHGFDAGGAVGGHHSLGLISMRERVRMLGGDFDVQSSADVGTVITVTLPTGEPRETTSHPR
jgi:signal transduction histidine kinase